MTSDKQALAGQNVPCSECALHVHIVALTSACAGISLSFEDHMKRLVSLSPGTSPQSFLCSISSVEKQRGLEPCSAVSRSASVRDTHQPAKSLWELRLELGADVIGDRGRNDEPG